MPFVDWLAGFSLFADLSKRKKKGFGMNGCLFLRNKLSWSLRLEHLSQVFFALKSSKRKLLVDFSLFSHTYSNLLKFALPVNAGDLPGFFLPSSGAVLRHPKHSQTDRDLEG